MISLTLFFLVSVRYSIREGGLISESRPIRPLWFCMSATQSNHEEADEACKKHHIHRPWSLWGMLTIPVSAGREQRMAQAMQEVSGAHG